MRTWTAIQEWIVVVALFVGVVLTIRSVRRRTWIHIRGRDRHKVVTAQDLWRDPHRRRFESGRGGGTGGGDGGGWDGGDGGDGGGGDGGGD